MEKHKSHSIHELMDILETNRYMNPAMIGFNAGHEMRKLSKEEEALRHLATIERFGGED